MAIAPVAPIETPCVGVCVMEADGLCRGCARTIDEIVGWGGMRPAERRSVMDRLADRRR